MKNDDFKKNFSIRLKNALDGRSQTSVAKKLGCSQGVVSKYILGDIPESFVLLSNLSSIYDIDLNWLLTGKTALSSESRITQYEIAIRHLLTYVYGFAADVLEKKEYLLKEKETILNDEDLQNNPAMRVRLGEIAVEIKSIEAKFEKHKKALAEVLKPTGMSSLM